MQCERLPTPLRVVSTDASAILDQTGVTGPKLTFDGLVEGTVCCDVGHFYEPKLPSCNFTLEMFEESYPRSA